MAKAISTILATARQRRCGHAMKLMKESLHLFGKVATIKATLKICVHDLDEGWRAHSALAGGGTMVDIGWHLLDAIIGLVNTDYTPSVAYTKMLYVRGAQGHDCEDSADLSRVGQTEVEAITITGEKAVLTFDGDEVCIHFEPATGEAHLRYDASQAADYRSDIERMFAVFNGQVQASKARLPLAMQHVCDDYQVQDLIVTGTLQAIYQHANKQLNSSLMILLKVVLSQLHKDISIYGNGGVFKEFESEFKGYHGVPSLFALLHNSGTNALHALYFAPRFMPGHEVIFPVYTFHAKCSPAMHFGIKPIFCDATNNGTISTSAHQSRNHRKDQGSGRNAYVGGQPVGTFGDGAAWSLQGQKIVTGGEGGITLTKHADFHYRQLLFGHYNKRCKLETPTSHPLRGFALTGAGMKNRAHPLAIAIALNQLRQLSGFHTWKTKYATQLIVQLFSIPFLDLPATGLGTGTEPAWYAFVMRFKAAKAPKGLTREVFVAELHERGLTDVDIPRSTGLLHREPLYNKPQDLLPHLYAPEYSSQAEDTAFEEAQSFYEEAIKIPVYATADGQAATNRYVRTILETAAAWMRKG
ncbi:MAG: hypothetical protein Q9208_002795 [Pyrenodesmia sp. 3 TL-2023]